MSTAPTELLQAEEDLDLSLAPAAAPPPARGVFDPINAAFLGAVHLLGLGGLVWILAGRAHWATIVLAVAWNAACSISITGGYHRLFAHRSHAASRVVKLFYLVFGAASVQNSALVWSSLHRRHHSDTDTDRDPYNALRGFWWSHVFWVVFATPRDHSNVPDLQADPFVRWQHRWYLALVGIVAFALPIGLAATWGDPWGGLLVAVALRLVVQYHSTFAVNSFAHLIGNRPYSVQTTARDSWLTALLTLGEGYHNYHHRFPSDYRNGTRWRDFDPTKWWLYGLSRLGLASELKRVPAPVIAAARAHARAEALTRAAAP